MAFLENDAQQVSRIGAFELPCDADVAFPLFSPEGERDWVSGWDPRAVFPKRVVFARDTVFRQAEGQEVAIWTIVDADWKTHRAEYVRVAADSHMAHIIVNVERLAAGRSRVMVSYTVTAFGSNAGALLESFSEEAYAEKMLNWQGWISGHLQRASVVCQRP